MPAPEVKLGTKFECFNCGTKFYDLGKSEPLCPKCGANQNDATPTSPAVSQASRRKRKAEVVPKPIEVDEVEPIEEVVDEEIAGAELDEIDEEVEEEFEDEA
jgi:uncharacterized protein (TIGR02300 family)